MTIRKRETGVGRPAIKSSHEKVKVTRRPKRAGAGASKTQGRFDVPASPNLRARAKPARRPRIEAQSSHSHGARGKVGEVGDAPPEPNGGWSVASDSSRAIAAAVAAAAIEKKAVAVEILDVAGKVDYADFLVIMTGRSDRHAQALAQGIEDALRHQSRRPVAVEGLPNGTWVLMDFGDVVVHVFQEEARQLYDIEGLWLDARRLPVPAPERP